MKTSCSKIRTVINLIQLAEANGYGGPWLQPLYLTLEQLIEAKRFSLNAVPTAG